MERKISAPGFILKGDGWTGQEIKRADQDEKLRSSVARAKEIKTSGKAKMDDVLSFKDVDNLNPE